MTPGVLQPPQAGPMHSSRDIIAGFAYLAPAQRRMRALPRSLLINGAALILLAGLTGCGPSYSPNTYSAAAVQQANTVERGVIVGVRRVGVSADSSVGTVTGGAAGGIVGSQAGPGGAITALSTLGGTVVGGLIGTSVEHAEGDTSAYEYIVRETNNSLVSVTQKDKAPLEIGQTVLVIAGKQARIVPDYTVPVPNELAASGTKAKSKPAATAATASPVVAAAASSTKPQAPTATASGGAATAPTASSPSAGRASSDPASSTAATVTSGGGNPAATTAASAAGSNTPAEAAASSAATTAADPPPLPPPLAGTAAAQPGAPVSLAPPQGTSSATAANPLVPTAPASRP